MFSLRFQGLTGAVIQLILGRRRQKDLRKRIRLESIPELLEPRFLLKATIVERVEVPSGSGDLKNVSIVSGNSNAYDYAPTVFAVGSTGLDHIFWGVHSSATGGDEIRHATRNSTQRSNAFNYSTSGLSLNSQFGNQYQISTGRQYRIDSTGAKVYRKSNGAETQDPYATGLALVHATTPNAPGAWDSANYPYLETAPWANTHINDPTIVARTGGVQFGLPSPASPIMVNGQSATHAMYFGGNNDLFDNNGGKDGVMNRIGVAFQSDGNSGLNFPWQPYAAAGQAVRPLEVRVKTSLWNSPADDAVHSFAVDSNYSDTIDNEQIRYGVGMPTAFSFQINAQGRPVQNGTTGQSITLGYYNETVSVLTGQIFGKNYLVSSYPVGTAGKVFGVDFDPSTTIRLNNIPSTQALADIALDDRGTSLIDDDIWWIVTKQQEGGPAGTGLDQITYVYKTTGNSVTDPLVLVSRIDRTSMGLLDNSSHTISYNSNDPASPFTADNAPGGVYGNIDNVVNHNAAWLRGEYGRIQKEAGPDNNYDDNKYLFLGTGKDRPNESTWEISQVRIGSVREFSPLYQVHNQSEHFFTTALGEALALVNPAVIPAPNTYTQDWSTTGDLNSLKTTGEVSFLLNQPGLNAFPGMPAVPIYRLNNVQVHRHYYTANKGELVGLLNAGTPRYWKYEGIEGYAFTTNQYNGQAVSGLAELRQFYNFTAGQSDSGDRVYAVVGSTVYNDYKNKSSQWAEQILTTPIYVFTSDQSVAVVRRRPSPSSSSAISDDVASVTTPSPVGAQGENVASLVAPLVRSRVTNYQGVVGEVECASKPLSEMSLRRRSPAEKVVSSIDQLLSRDDFADALFGDFGFGT